MGLSERLRPSRYWLSGLLLLIGAPGCGGDRQHREPWNVVLLMVDTLRADHLTPYGYERPTAPRLAEWVSRGILFEQARSQAGCTFPSVNSVLTSAYPAQFIDYRNEGLGIGIPPALTSVAEILQERGYATAAVSSSAIVRKSGSSFNPRGGFDAGFARFHESCHGAPASAECVTDEAVSLLRRTSEPFFLYLHYMEPHMPFRAPFSHRKVFAAERHDKPWVADGRLQPLKRMIYDGGAPVEFDEADRRHTFDLYDEDIRYLDGELSRLIDVLESDRLLERTIVVFAADHGEELMEHGDLFHCRNIAWETVLKTPLVFWIPGLEPGRSDGLVQNLDIVPTVLDYLGSDPADYRLDGVSLRPLIESGRPVNRFSFALQGLTWVVTDGRYKLLFDLASEEARLYDLEKDPGESVDIFDEEDEVSTRLFQTLARWMEATASGSLKERMEKAEAVTEMLKALGYL